jgi:hypothetical protein
MTGSYCSSCGAEKTPGASFCASCGAAVAAPPAAPPVAPPAGGAPQPQYSAAPAHPPVPPPYPAPQQPVQGPYAGTQQPWNGASASAQAAPPAAAPWGAPGPAAPQRTPGKSTIDALLTGDWGGAARTAGLAVGVMTAVSLVGMLLVSEGGIGFRETMALVLAGVCLAVGGDGYAEAAVESFGTSLSLGLLPLTVTLAGLGVLGWSFARQLRSSGPATATDALLQGVRTALVFTAFFLPLSLLTRYSTEDSTILDVQGRLGVGVVSTVIGALLFAVATLGLTWLFRRSTALPARVAAFRDKALAPLLGAVAVFCVGLLAVLGALIYGLVEESDKMIQIGVAVLTAGNGALAAVLWAAGVPLNLEGSANGGPLGQFSPSGSDSVDLFTFTDESAWFWLAPVALLAAMVLVATALAVRQNTIEDARREGFRFAGALALVAFLATLLLQVGVDGGAAEFATADASAMFNPIVAAFVLAVWGVLTGLLAPVVAARVPGGFVANVRRRFGVATEVAPPVS